MAIYFKKIRKVCGIYFCKIYLKHHPKSNSKNYCSIPLKKNHKPVTNIYTYTTYIILDTMDISNQEPTDTIRELSPMDIQLCSQGETNEDSLSEQRADLSQDVQRTPISSQVVPMNDLGLSSQCSSSCATPSKDTPISTPKTRKRKGYRATKDRKRDAIKKRRKDDRVS